MQLQPEPALVPAQPFAAGRAQQIHNFINLYCDSAVRPLIPAAYFGAPAPPELLEAAREKLAQGFAALKQVVRFEPFVAGEAFTHADLAAVNTLGLAEEIASRLDLPRPSEHLPGFREYTETMHRRPHVERVFRERAEAIKRLTAQMAGAS